MNLAYITSFKSSDIHEWSGLIYHIHQALQHSNFRTECIDNLKSRGELSLKIKKALYAKIAGKTYLRDRGQALLMQYAVEIEKALNQIDHDIIFSPSTLPIAYIKTDKPIVFWADATFSGMMDFYPEYSNLCSESIRDAYDADQLSLSKCSLALYASEWAASTAISNYDVDPRKVKVVPFGANIICDRTIRDVESILDKKKYNVCKLLFMGVSWSRKGGDVALMVANLLNQQGIQTELHVVGCQPPIDDIPNFVKLYGFISKNLDTGREYLDKLMAESHFLILPSKAECYGVVFAEASSFGLPSLATDVGGISTAIHNGKNGQTFQINDSPQKYCDYIARLMSDVHQYRELSLSSFAEYSDRLNWTSSGNKVKDLIMTFCN